MKLTKFFKDLWNDERGQVTVTSILAGSYMKIVDITATADGDTTATITHGLVVTPLFISMCQLVSQALTALSAWAFSAPGATTSTGTKLTSTGSGNANPQVRVAIWAPHSSVI